MENESGTVRYHRAEYDTKGERNPDCVWLVWFTEDPTRFRGFTVAEGEAMGLTPPEPAPLVVTCGAHSIELSDEEATELIAAWGYCEDDSGRSPLTRGKARLARLLRDARQDPQPASEPEQYDAASDIDFDALPIGTVAEVTLSTGNRLLAVKDGKEPGYLWYCGDNSIVRMDNTRDAVIVYQPAPLSPGECLRGLLAGRDDADELIEYAKQWGGRGLTSDGRWRAVIGDAARGGA